MVAKKFVKIKTRFGEFECLFESNAPDKGYTVTVPKLKGVVTSGDTMTEARAMAREAIELHCECLFKEGSAKIRILRTAKTRELTPA